MLKNILSLLLSKFYSKKESEAVGHQATPSDSYVDFTLSKTETSSLGSTEEILNAIAPCDGYLFVRGRSLTDSHRLILSTRAGMYINAYGKTITTQGTVVVFKGENISVSAVSMTDLKVRLYKFVGSVSGGGVSTLKKLLLQGGGLCLNSLSSSLRKSSLSVKRNGSDIRLFRITVLALTLRSNRTLHLQTDGLAFVRPLLNLIVLLTQRAELLHGFLVMRSHLLRQQQHCLFLRVKHLPSTSQAEYQKFGSHQLTVPQLNFALGGASC